MTAVVWAAGGIRSTLLPAISQHTYIFTYTCHVFLAHNWGKQEIVTRETLLPSFLPRQLSFFLLFLLTPHRLLPLPGPRSIIRIPLVHTSKAPLETRPMDKIVHKEDLKHQVSQCSQVQLCSQPHRITTQ